MENQVTAQAKECAHCHRTLTADNFNGSKTNSDGLQSWCKECSSKYYRLERLYRKQGKGGVTDSMQALQKIQGKKGLPKI
jgi:hypothetical protein